MNLIQIISWKQKLHKTRTRAQQELFKEEKEINLFNIFSDNCRSFVYLNPEIKLSLISFNDHMKSTDLCIYVQIFIIYNLCAMCYIDQKEKAYLFRLIPGKYIYYLLNNLQFEYMFGR